MIEKIKIYTYKLFFESSNKNLYVFLLIISLIVQTILKLYYILPIEFPIIFGDEPIFKHNAFYLFSMGNTDQLDFCEGYVNEYHPRYPILYPLVLSLSFLGGNNFYFYMKIINIIISSMIFFPVFLIARNYLSFNKSILMSIISLFIPFNFFYPRLIMAENLFYFIFLLSIYFIIKFVDNNNYKNSILCGVFIGLSILTRYFALIFLPIIFFIFLISFFFEKSDINFKKRIKLRILHFFIMSTALFITVLPFILMNFDYIFFQFNKFYLANDYTSPQKYNIIKNYVIWFLNIFSYFILLISPLILMIIISIRYIFKISSNIKYKNLFIIIFSITVFWILLCTKHMGNWNYQTEGFLEGRYLLYLFCPWLLFSFIYTDFIISNIKLQKKQIFISLVISVILIMLSYLAIIKSVFWKNVPWLIMGHVAHEGSLFQNSYIPIFLVILITFLISIFLMISKLNTYKYSILSILIIIFVLILDIKDFKKDVTSHFVTPSIKIGKEINNFLNDNKTNRNYIIYNDLEKDKFFDNKSISVGISFWNIGKYKFHIKSKSDITSDVNSCNSSKFILTKEKMVSRNYLINNNGIFLYSFKE